jgi:hypothetical protein
MKAEALATDRHRALAKAYGKSPVKRPCNGGFAKRQNCVPSRQRTTGPALLHDAAIADHRWAPAN